MSVFSLTTIIHVSTQQRSECDVSIPTPSKGSGGRNSDVVKKMPLNSAPFYFRKLSISQNNTLPHNHLAPSTGSGERNSDVVKKTPLNCAPFYFQKSSVSQNATLSPSPLAGDQEGATQMW